MNKSDSNTLYGQQNVHLVWLLARPGYIRNGIEASLRAIEGLIVQIYDDQELTMALLEEKHPDLILVSPAGLAPEAVLQLCEGTTSNRERCLLIVEPYAEKSELKLYSACKLVEIETSAQLRQLVLATLNKLDSQHRMKG
jgi:hypothetical protein